MISKTKTDNADRFEWDTKLPGFGIRTRDGRRTYVVQYKLGAQQRRITIGSVAKLTREQAVKEAKKIFGRVAAGEDPQGARKAARQAVTATDTFGAVADQFIEYQEGLVDQDKLRPSSVTATRRYLLVRFKRLHGLKIDAVPRLEVTSTLKTIKDHHGPVAADRAGSAISSLFSWAVREGLIVPLQNPATDLNKFAGTTSRDRVLKDEELAAIWLAAGDDDYGRIIKLLISTGQRRDEIAGLDRAEIRDGFLEIPGTRTKNHRPHIVPLVDTARSIVEDQASKTNRDQIFGRGDSGRGFSGFSKAKKELDAKLPGLKPWVVHDIRRAVSTGMSELGVEPHIVEAVLNHVSGYRAGVAGVYNKAAYLEPKTAALTLWANHLAMVLAQASGANVSRLHDRKRGVARRKEIA
jgi:integrase